MAFCTVNGAPVLEGTISLPRIGVWTADVELPAPSDSSKTLAGVAQIALGTSLSFTGTFASTGLDGRGRIRARVIGGAAGLGKTLTPKSYLGAPLRLPLTDILTDCGEKLSSTADQTLLASQMPAWSRMQAVAGVSLGALVAAVSATWRVLSDGTVWLGTDLWSASGMQAIALSYEPEARRRVVASLAPSVLPGQTYDGARVSFVQHVVDARSLRTVLQLE